PLEAGEDGTFDLGSPSPPASPVKPVRKKQNAAEGSKAPVAESELCGSPPIKDDWEKVDLKGADDGPPLPPEKSNEGGGPPPPPEESLEDFKDAVEGNFTTEQTDTAQQAGTERAAGSGGSGVDSDAADTRSGQAAAAETSVSQPPSIVEERPPPATGRA
ncbi:unnamed protein product, partial [Pylaiella littoralis]